MTGASALCDVAAPGAPGAPDGATCLYGKDERGGWVLVRTVDAEVVAPEHFSDHDVRHVHVGRLAREVSVPRVCDALLDSLSVDEANPHLSTDGQCLFSCDGATLLRCLSRVQRYRVPASCRAIGPEAFAYNSLIHDIDLPSGLTDIGQRAFIGSGLHAVELPATVRTVGADAFARSRSLRTVRLNAGLLELGDEAFVGCAQLEGVDVPASVRYLGKDVFRGCKLRAADGSLAVSVDAANRRYSLDGFGVLYRSGERGLTLIAALGELPAVYRVRPNTVRIEPRAFAHCRRLERIELADGLTYIGEGAFFECVSLARAELPAMVRFIGDKAFYHTALDRVDLPASLDHLGLLALVPAVSAGGSAGRTLMGDAVRPQAGMFGELSGAEPSNGQVGASRSPGRRPQVTVAAGNERYRVVHGFLCEHGDDGEVRALQYVEDGETVTVPSEATSVRDYAMLGATRTRALHVHDRIAEVGTRGLSVPVPLDYVRVDRANGEPVLVYPADNRYGVFAQNQAFSHGFLDLAQLANLCDTSLVRMRPGFERTRRMVARLANGQLLAASSREMFLHAVAGALDEAVARFARADELDMIGRLLDLGLIDAGNVVHAAEVANAAGGVAATRLLMEQKRRRFGARLLDLEL